MVAGSRIPSSALERLIEDSDDIVFALDRHGRIRHLNPAFERHTGFPLASWLGRHWAGLVVEPDARRVRALWSAAPLPEGRSGRVRIRTASGGSLDLMIRLCPGGATDDPITLGTARPRAAPAELEARLQASEARFERVFHASPTPATIQRLADGRYLWANDAYLRVSGYGRAELLGRSPHELALWADRRERDQAVARLAEHGVLDGLRARLRTRSGEIRTMLCSWVIIDLQAEPCIFSLAVDVTYREQAEAQLRALPLRLVEAQEVERRRMARELHDEIGQALTGLHMQLMALPRDGEVPAGGVAEALDTVAGLIDQVRTLSLDLHARVLEDIGLEAALRDLTDRHLARAGLRVHLDLSRGVGPIPAETAAACFRIAQEAVTNVVRHAGAANVWIGLERQQERLELYVEDDGVGMDPAAAAEGFGFRGMRERTSLAGGRLDVSRRAGGGTRVAACLHLGNLA